MARRKNVVWFLLGMVLLIAGCPNSGDTQDTAQGTDTSPDPGTTPATSTPPAASASWSGDAFDFMYTSFAGGQSKASGFAGKPLVVNFWAAW